MKRTALLTLAFLMSAGPAASAAAGVAGASFSHCQNGRCTEVNETNHTAFATRELPKVSGGSYRRDGCTACHCVTPGQYALTFDDGPSTNVPAILAILRKHKIKATFFVVGDYVQTEQGKAALRLLAQDGHMIANHTMHHASLLTLTDSEALSQLERTRAAIADIIGSTERVTGDSLFFRPPYGELDRHKGDFLRARGYIPILWNSDRCDWDDTYDEKAILDRLEQHLTFLQDHAVANDSIIDLNHGYRETTLRALPKMIERIKSEGYTFVTVRECLTKRPEALTEKGQRPLH